MDGIKCLVFTDKGIWLQVKISIILMLNYDQLRRNKALGQIFFGIKVRACEY